MKLKSALILLILGTTASYGADIPTNQCVEKTITHAAISYSESSLSSDNLGKRLQDKNEILNKIAKKYEFQEYKMLSKNISISKDTNNSYIVSSSFQLEFLQNYDHISKLTSEAGSQNISFEIHTECKLF